MPPQDPLIFQFQQRFGRPPTSLQELSAFEFSLFGDQFGGQANAPSPFALPLGGSALVPPTPAAPEQQQSLPTGSTAASAASPGPTLTASGMFNTPEEGIARSRLGGGSGSSPAPPRSTGGSIGQGVGSTIGNVLGSLLQGAASQGGGGGVGVNPGPGQGVGNVLMQQEQIRQRDLENRRNAVTSLISSLFGGGGGALGGLF